MDCIILYKQEFMQVFFCFFGWIFEAQLNVALSLLSCHNKLGLLYVLIVVSNGLEGTVSLVCPAKGLWFFCHGHCKKAFFY